MGSGNIKNVGKRDVVIWKFPAGQDTSEGRRIDMGDGLEGRLHSEMASVFQGTGFWTDQGVKRRSWRNV